MPLRLINVSACTNSSLILTISKLLKCFYDHICMSSIPEHSISHSRKITTFPLEHTTVVNKPQYKLDLRQLKQRVIYHITGISFQEKK